MALELEKVKQTLDLLVQKQLLSEGRRDWVLDGIKRGVHKGAAGEVVIKQDWGITKEHIDNVLREQAAQKSYAAVADIDTIVAKGHQDIPAWLKVNLGNNGVNPAANQPTLVDGASAAANIAQNIIIYANSAPQLAPQLVNAVRSAAALSLYLSGAYPETVPATALQQWQQEANDGLRLVAAHFESTEKLRDAVLHSSAADAQKAPGTQQVEAYLEQRNAEIASAIGQALPWQSRVFAAPAPSAGPKR